MSDETEQPTATLNITLGFDACGDPLLKLEAEFPKDGAVPLDVAEHLALYLLANVQTARAYAAVSRKMMLDGLPAQAVVHFLRDVMIPQ